MARFNQAKNFKMTKNFTLAREFFKQLGNFTNEDLKVFVQYLLGKTSNRTCSNLKMTMYMTSKQHRTYYFATEWVDHKKKKKMIVL
jgi:hypothetical protein